LGGGYPENLTLKCASELAANLLSLAPSALGKAQREGKLMEVDCGTKEEITNP
jgi:hypothetical protein